MFKAGDKQNCDFKVGDKVYNFFHGEGIIEKISKNTSLIKFDKEIDIFKDKHTGEFYNRDIPAMIDEYKQKHPVDMVNHPLHYCQEGGLECIDVMQLLFGKQAVIDYCRCNIFKYRFRAEHKNGDEDIKKAQWYENKLNELLGAGFTVKGKA